MCAPALAKDPKIAFVRSHRYWITGAAALAAALVFVVFEFVTAPQIGAVSPAPGSYLDHPPATISLTVSGAERLHGLSVRLDGRDVTRFVRVGPDRLYFSAGPLSDGQHTVAFAAQTSDLLRPHVAKTWRFGVDTVPPTLHLTTPPSGAVQSKSPVKVTGTTEPGATVKGVAGGASATAIATGDGRFALALAPADGPVTLRLTATDAAGNATGLKRGFLADATPPELTVTGLTKVERTASPRVGVVATDAAGTPTVRVRLDGRLIVTKATASQIKLPMDKLPEGTHAIVVSATDRGGHVTSKDTGFLVNSTDKLGKATLIAGARGKDVRTLQKRLKKEHVYRGRLTGVLDPKTVRAVKRMEVKLGLPVDGIVGPELLGGLAGRIVIDQSEHRLYFYLDGKLKATFPVATGQPAYPTPNGVFSVVWMTMNPTWTPPDSPWAAGAAPVPPGPNNPVGMRWIGTSYPGVGIHGVPPAENSSIGTYASHGCIRMFESNVEQLYGWVKVGMPVIIRP